MFAVIKTGGKQYRVVANDVLKIEKLAGKAVGVALILWALYWGVRAYFHWYRYQNDIWAVTNQRLVDSIKRNWFHHQMASADLVDVEDIRAADRCEFGKWLYGARLSAEDRESLAYREVESLHAEFHRVAAQVVELAAAGQTVEAYGLLYGDYVTMSGRLAIALRAWKESLAGQPGKSGASSEMI